MKIIIAVLCALVAFAAAQQSQQIPVKKGQDLISLMEGDAPGTYLVFFFDRNADKGKIALFRNKAKEQILAKHPDVRYYEVDVDDAGYQDLIELVKIDKVEVNHMPTLLLITQGLGYTVHGEKAVEEISNSLNTKDWWLAHRHQRTEKDAADAKNPPAQK